MFLSESPAFRAKHGRLSDLVARWLGVDQHELAAAAHELITTGSSEPIVNGRLSPAGGPEFRFDTAAPTRADCGGYAEP